MSEALKTARWSDPTHNFHLPQKALRRYVKRNPKEINSFFNSNFVKEEPKENSNSSFPILRICLYSETWNISATHDFFLHSFHKKFTEWIQQKEIKKKQKKKWVFKKMLLKIFSCGVDVMTEWHFMNVWTFSLVGVERCGAMMMMEICAKIASDFHPKESENRLCFSRLPYRIFIHNLFKSWICFGSENLFFRLLFRIVTIIEAAQEGEKDLPSSNKRFFRKIFLLPFFHLFLFLCLLKTYFLTQSAPRQRTSKNRTENNAESLSKAIHS